MAPGCSLPTPAKMVSNAMFITDDFAHKIDIKWYFIFALICVRPPPFFGSAIGQLTQYSVNSALLGACLRLSRSKQTAVSCGFCEFAFLFVSAWFRVNKLSDSNTDVQALKISSTQFQQRVSVSRIKRIQSQIFSMQPGLPVQLNTGVSKNVPRTQESRCTFSS